MKQLVILSGKGGTGKATVAAALAHLAALFEEPQTVRARIRRIDFLKHTVTLVPEGDG